MREALRRRLVELRDQGMQISAVNPVAALADLISEQLAEGRIDRADIAGLLAETEQDIWADRHQQLRIRTGLAGLGQNLLPEGFDPVAADITRPVYRAVFTAHPVFALTETASAALSKAAGKTRPGTAPAGLHDRRAGITLVEEHAEAMAALSHARAAIRDINRQIFEARQTARPESWCDQLALMLGVSSWVGYDLDGRADIKWADSFSLRLREKQAGLQIYLDQLAAIDLDELAEIRAEIQAEQAATEAEIALFSGLRGGTSELADAANQLTGRKNKLTHSKALAERLQAVAQACTDQAAALAVMVLASDMHTHGFGMGEMHLRINAVQLRNAMRSVDGRGVMVSGGGVSHRLLMDRLGQRITKEGPWKINFANLDRETATARRQLMLAAQILKHIDSDQPVRLLIAECERPVTLMSALYLAHKFDIADQLDISPLFETVIGLERGVQMMEQLLSNKVWQRYIQRRGRLAVQTGFSDAGRFLGQITANLAIERLQIKIAQLVAGQFGNQIDLLLFNTHGESLGRGGAGPTIAERQDFILTPFVRSRAGALGLHIYHQSSFQGGDGYRLFGTAELARGSMASLLRAETKSPPEAWIEDPFYRQSDFSLDLFLALKSWHEGLFSDPDYTSLLDMFGANLLPKTGSRPAKRVVQAGMGRRDPSKMRAIPHNAILQQLGFLANVISGLGSAASIDAEVFASMAESSPRLQQILAHVLAAKRLGSLNTMLAYARLLDNGFWIDRGYHDIQPGNLRGYRMLGRVLAGRRDASNVARVVWKMRDDLIDLYQLTRQTGLDGVRVTGQQRTDLDILHAVRIALIIDSLLLVCRVPRFAESGQYSNAQMLNLALALDFDSVQEIVTEIFSLDAAARPGLTLEEPQSYAEDNAENYRQISDQILRPLAENKELILQISQMISGYYGAHG